MSTLHLLGLFGLGFFTGGLFGMVLGFTKGRLNGHREMFYEFVYRIESLAKKGGTLSELVDEVADTVPPNLDADGYGERAEGEL